MSKTARINAVRKSKIVKYGKPNKCGYMIVGTKPITLDAFGECDAEGLEGHGVGATSPITHIHACTLACMHACMRAPDGESDRARR